MSATLSQAATAAGLIDPDLLKVARTDITPADAVADLRNRFPGAFHPPTKRACEMTPTEFRQGMRQMAVEESVRNMRAMNGEAGLKHLRKRLGMKD